jgi:hypothetical protein
MAPYANRFGLVRDALVLASDHACKRFGQAGRANASLVDRVDEIVECLAFRAPSQTHQYSDG